MNDYSFLFTPLSLIIILTAALTAYFHIAATRRAVGDARNVRDTLMTQAKVAALRSFTVVIPYRRQSESIMKLLDHLASQHYDQLEIIVVLYRGVWKAPKKELEAYRRRYKQLNIRLVTHRRNISDEAIVRKYARNEQVLKMYPHERLSRHFFVRASYALATEPEALKVRSMYRPGKTLASAFIAILKLWQTILWRITGRHPLFQWGVADGVIIPRRLIIEGAIYQPEPILYDQLSVVSKAPSKVQLSLITSIVTLVIAGFAVAILISGILTVSALTLQFVLILLAIVYLISSPLLLFDQKGLKKGEIVQLLTLFPIYPFWLVIIAAISVVKNMARRMSKSLHPAARPAPRRPLSRTR